MSNDKPTATAIIRFFPEGKRVTVELDSITGVSPRKLEIANNLLMRQYRGMRGAANAARHREAREAEVSADVKKVKDAKAFDKKEEKRLEKATAKVEAKTEVKGIKRLEAALKAAKKRLQEKAKN